MVNSYHGRERPNSRVEGDPIPGYGKIAILWQGMASQAAILFQLSLNRPKAASPITTYRWSYDLLRDLDSQLVPFLSFIYLSIALTTWFYESVSPPPYRRMSPWAAPWSSTSARLKWPTSPGRRTGTRPRTAPSSTRICWSRRRRRCRGRRGERGGTGEILMALVHAEDSCR